MQKSHRKMRGFEYLASSVLSSVLLAVMVFLPLAPVFASEEAASIAFPVALESSNPVEEIQPTPVSDPPVAVAGDSPVIEGVLPEPELDAVLPVQSETTSVQSADLGTDTESIIDQSSSGSDVIVVPEDQTGIELNDSAASGTEALPSDTEESSTEDMPSASEPQAEATTTTQMPVAEAPVIEQADETIEPEIIEPEIVEPEAEEEAEATTMQGETVAVNSVMNDENLFSFGRNECVSVGDGSFYCTEGEEAPKASGADRVFAAVDADGDREIYIERDGELTAVTENLMEDDAPFYDAASETIVWHRLIDGRYQIVEFDTETREEKVLTGDRYNNMEPTRSDDITVWQGWVGDDWEIMLDIDGDTAMLTDNTHHDIAPHINGAYIVWQSFEGNAWRVKVYDTVTEKIETIDDAEGASVENPRFVLVYDTKTENGDIETKGYDLESKRIIPLGSRPVPIPKLPDPDQTGEDRALVQTLIQIKPKEGESTPDDVPPPTDAVGDAGTTTPSVPGDIVIPPLETASSTIESDSDTATSTEDIADVILPPVESNETTATEHIEDVIVAPFVEPTETATDPQLGVATST